MNTIVISSFAHIADDLQTALSECNREANRFLETHQWRATVSGNSHYRMFAHSQLMADNRWMYVIHLLGNEEPCTW